MAGSGIPSLKVDGKGLKVTIVAAQWHKQVMDGLIEGAKRACADAGAQAMTVRVPGSFELPLACKTAAQKADAVVALGVVIRGGTPHPDYVCEAATNGLTQASLLTGTPIGFGVLTCDNGQQALDRAGLEGSAEDKGYEAAEAAMAMVATLEQVGA